MTISTCCPIPKQHHIPIKTHQKSSELMQATQKEKWLCLSILDGSQLSICQ